MPYFSGAGLPGHEAPPPGGREGSWPRTGVRRRPAGRRACGTGRPGVPGSGRVPCLPRRRVVPARPSPLPPQRHSRSRRAGIAAAAPRAERHRWKTAPDAGHAVKLGQGAQNHQVGKEGCFMEQRFRSLCVIHERFVNDPEDFGAALDNPVQGLCVQQAAGRIAGICQKNSASVCGLFLQTAKRREEGIPFLRPDGKNLRAVAQAGQPVFGKAGSGMTACLRFNARGRA